MPAEKKTARPGATGTSRGEPRTLTRNETMKSIQARVASATVQDFPPQREPAAPPTRDKTTAQGFNDGFGAPMFQVNAGIASECALSEADVILAYVKRQLEAALDNDDRVVGSMVQFQYDDIHVLIAMLDMSKALRVAAGATA
ncbi:hypothetical protein RM61_07190 [Xanthomonas phaseoli pv. phaseoli]|nr:hypothetical protein RM61_07190 [Xanthomonas phaseoli pv. phaseoli]